MMDKTSQNKQKLSDFMKDIAKIIKNQEKTSAVNIFLFQINKNKLLIISQLFDGYFSPISHK